jgi:sugar O-acyltransferase (sialic acid O-acetyltransferase NeuD family)
MPTNTTNCEQLCLLGAGGHAKVVIDALLCQPQAYSNIQLYDDNQELSNVECLGLSIKIPLPDLSLITDVAVHIAIGNNALRQQLAAKVAAAKLSYASIIHPRAVMANSASIADGCFLAALSITGPDVVIASGTIINHAAIVDHDCQVGSYCHIAPNVTLGGNVVIGNNVLIGAGATVLPGVEVCERAQIGAGAVVTKNITKAGTYTGIPAR